MEGVVILVGQFVILAFSMWTLAYFVDMFRAHILSRIIPKDFVKTYGEWAVITGCTDGIGKAYMHELAKRGMNIVLVSINEDDLQRCSKEIRELYGVRTETVEVDFRQGKPVYEKIRQALSEKEIGILVNNVGIGFRPRLLSHLFDDFIIDTINVNTMPTPIISKMALASMVPKRKGIIINISSMSAYSPMPFGSIYAASKSFVYHVSCAMRNEYKDCGITVQTVCPFFIATSLTSFSDLTGKASCIVPDPATFARNAVSTIGFAETTTGYWVFDLMKFVHDLMPLWCRIYLARKTNEVLSK